jgi:hypothetical protein
VSEALATYLDMLYGAEPDGSFAEIRFKLRNGGMGQDFLAVRDRERLARLIQARGAKTDLYLGVAPRRRQEGTRDAVKRLHALYVDADAAEAIAGLEEFQPAPSVVIASGSGQHAYWSLWPPASPDEAEKANKRLAHALGADMQATDCARILRPPQTFNFKTGTPRPVTLERLAGEVYTAEDVVGHLPDLPSAERRPTAPVRALTATDDPLMGLPAAIYIEALTGQEIGRDAKINCPFHRDNTPSLHVFERAKTPGSAPGWKCFGCNRSGSIVDFGAAFYNLEPRGRGFHEIRRRLEADLLGVAA